MLTLTLWLLAAAPLKPLPLLSAPLGRLGDVVEPPSLGGIQGGETVLVGKLDGCGRDQQLNLTRLLAGSLVAVQQIQDWLNQTPGLEKKLFAAGKLGEVVKRVAASSSAEQRLCTAPLLVDGFKLGLDRAGARLCPAEPGWRMGDFWWAQGGRPAAAISVSPAPEGAPDRCRPRFSVVLFDKGGVARVWLDADYGGVASFSLLGDRCLGFDFSFDATTQTFVPTWRTPKSCKG